MGVLIERATVWVSNIHQTAIAEDLLHYLENQLGRDSVFAIEILSDHKNWKSRGIGRVQFSSLEFKSKAQELSINHNLVFKSQNLKISETYSDIIPIPVNTQHRVENCVLHGGIMKKDGSLYVLEAWEGVRGWLLPQRKRVEFWIWQNQNGESQKEPQTQEGECCYKVEISYEDVLETVGGCLDSGGKLNGILLKLKYGPKIYQKVSGPSIGSKFHNDRYHICKDNFDFLWVRTTDFSVMKTIGQSTSFCWEIQEGSFASDICASLPYYNEDKLTLEKGELFRCTSEIVPLVKCRPGLDLAYEILFQLNSLVHNQKVSFAAVDAELIEILSGLTTETALMVLQKLHKLKSTCYDPVKFVKNQLNVLGRNYKSIALSSHKRLMDHNVMSCYRALVTPSKIYCLGPELETSNYVVKNFATYASDFIRVTFVEEDWSKLPSNALSTSIQRGIFAKPYRTKIYHRILSILRDGIVIGDKRYEFLAFSASQLRSNSVWMFASNDKARAEDIREWMGCFNKIRSVSKCAARMGQLFSSSRQTFLVAVQEVENIPDVKVTSDGITYCFSDGIGKISQSFARQVAQKCGLSHTPSAFQIRYGGYKGVIAVDRNSYRKLSLRSSMLKFESKNRMLNVTKWSDSMPCFLNREIISLLSTLGIKDEVFEAMQHEQLHLLGKMLTNREAALSVLQSFSSADAKNILVKILLQGYEPNVEPYLSMMLQSHHESQLSDLKSRCRIYVPKGRLLIGCLDETGILNYGQVYICVTVTKEELEYKDQSCFHRVDEKTSVVIGKVLVTKNPCLHPGDIRVLEAVYEVELEEKGLVDCIIFPQNGERPHPNECSGGDLDGDIFFISWDKDLIPCETDPPMDYTGGRPRKMDHDVTLEEIHKFFVDYMINDTLGAISTAHLVHADREPDKARSPKCLHLATLHSMAVDFAKTGAPAEIPLALKPKEFPDFMERVDKPMYTSSGVLGKLYRATLDSIMQKKSNVVWWSKKIAEARYDCDLEVDGFEAFLEQSRNHRDQYKEEMSKLMNYYGVEAEVEILTGNLRNKAAYLQRDNRRYGDMKDRILLSVKNIQMEAKEWFENCCQENEHQRLASAWYHVTYHPSCYEEGMNFLSFPWIVGDILLNIKSVNSRKAGR